MVDYLIVGTALALAVFILARQAMRIGRGGGCGCEGGGAQPVRQRQRRARHIEDALQSLNVIAKAELPSTVIVRSKHPVDKEACSKAVRKAGYEVIETQL